MAKMNGILNEKRTYTPLGGRGGFGMRDPDPLRNKNSESEECRTSIMVAWERVNALITDGKLRGNGTDKTAERNGLIIAANIIAEVIREEGSYDTKDRGRNKRVRDYRYQEL